MSTKVITFDIALYPLQQEISDDETRFRVLACGRRWGKSLLAMMEAWKMLLRGYEKTGKKQRVWVVSPTFPLVKEDWLIAESVLKNAIFSKKISEMKLDCGPLGMIEFKSAEREDEGLRGAGLDGCIIDEASRVSQKSWEQGIRPALADKQGRALFISTPKGRNWFYDIYLMGKNEESEWKSWHYPTYTNPFFPQSEWDVIVKTTPEMIRKQEYEADFLEDEASVFKNVSKCFRGTLEDPIKGELYTTGVDLARIEDFTVITTIRNSTCQVVNTYRVNEVDWSLQKKQIKAIASKYPGLVYLDSTGLGDPIEEDLRKSGVNVKGFKFSNTSKQELIEQLVVAIEQGLIGIPVCNETQRMIDEIKAFSYELLPSGRVRYSAPVGLYDDEVIALGLAVRGIWPLLYQKKKVEVEKKPWGTSKDWDDLYDSIERTQRLNPFMTKEQVYNRLKYKRYKSIIRK